MSTPAPAPETTGARTFGRRTTRALAALSGVLAAALTLAAGELVATLTSPPAAPFIAVGNSFIDLTPGWLKDFAIDTFGTNDKIALLVGMGLIITVLAAVIGVLAHRKRILGDVLIGVLGLVGVAAALSRANTGALAPLPSVVGAALGLVALRLMLSRLGSSTDASPEPGTSRRAFLVTAGSTGALAVLSLTASRALGAGQRSVAAIRRALRLPAPTTPADPVPDAVISDVPGVVPWQTPNEDFYRIDTALQVPQVDPSTWSLRIHGMVEEEVEITFDELLERDLIETWVTLSCVSNEVGGRLAGNARWLGLPIRELLKQARPTGNADMVLSTSNDGWTASTPLESLTDPGLDAILAVGMNGEPLPAEHGFPVRMVVPGLYGFVSATKWVVDLEVTRYDEKTAYWTDRDWSERAPIKTFSRIEVPTPLARQEVGDAVAAGTAWAQTRGVERVEVRVDDGPWEEAELTEAYNDQTWVQWRYPYQLEEGRHTLTVRATDGNGDTQPEERVDPIPNGATGWHSITVTGTI